MKIKNMPKLESLEEEFKNEAGKMNKDRLNTPDLYSPCCLHSLMKPFYWMLGVVVFKCVRCGKRWNIKKTDIDFSDGEKNGY